MRAACLLLGALMLTALGGAELSAQTDRGQVLLIVGPDCRPFIMRNVPRTPADTTDAVELLRSCILEAQAAVDRIELNNQDLLEGTVAFGSVMVSDDELNQHLSRRRYEYKRLTKQLRRVRGAAEAKGGQAWADHMDATASGARLGNSIDVLLERRGLKRSFSSALVSGAIFNTLDANNGAFDVDREDGTEVQPTPQAYLAWESRHLGSSADNIAEFNVRGRIGFVPAIALLETDSAALAMGQDTISARFKDAFVWTLGVQVNRPVATKAEVSLTGSVGQTRLNTTAEIVRRGDDQLLLIDLVDNDTRTAWFGEVGLELNVFDRSLEMLHTENDFLSPLFRVGIGYKRDVRFKADGDLIRSDSDQDRLYFRLMIDALEVADRRDEQGGGRTFTVGFGVEHERRWIGDDSKVPSATRFVLRGDLDFLKALQGG